MLPRVNGYAHPPSMGRVTRVEEGRTTNAGSVASASLRDPQRPGRIHNLCSFEIDHPPEPMKAKEREFICDCDCLFRK